MLSTGPTQYSFCTSSSQRPIIPCKMSILRQQTKFNPQSVFCFWQSHYEQKKRILTYNLKKIGKIPKFIFIILILLNKQVKKPRFFFFSTAACSPDMILFILRLKMVSIQEIRQRHQFKKFVRNVALVELG